MSALVRLAEAHGAIGPERYSCPAVKQQQLRAWVGERRRRGEFADTYSIKISNGQAHAYVLRLRPQPRRAPRVLAAVALGAGTLTWVGWALWEARWVILAVTSAALVGAAVVGLLAVFGHRPGCVGLHCSGCRG